MMQEITVWSAVTPAIFHEQIRPLCRPAILRQCVSDWPIIYPATTSGEGAKKTAALLSAMATPAPIQAVRAAPEMGGRLHYSADLRGMNFARITPTLPQFLAALIAAASLDHAPTLAAQGIVVPAHLPGFTDTHAMPLLAPTIIPRIWIGNAAKVATHNDPSENLAIVAAGRRRFTLFPPDQLPNLYMGPFHPTPAGTPVSMVHVTAPDHARYPRYATALAAACVADLAPGDGLYIPYGWYHHVEAFGPFNILVNYWWNDARTDLGSPWDALMHAMMSLRALPEDQRGAWRAMFETYVFAAHGDAAAHLPDHARGILAADTPADIAAMRQSILRNLGQG